MWGLGSTTWINDYHRTFHETYDVKVFDSRELAGIDPKISGEQEIHRCFLHGGVETAVSHLLSKVQRTNVIVGFSIGGLIAWKAALQGLACQQLIAVCSTRLRLETQRPVQEVKLIYGDQDAFAPQKDWFQKMKLVPVIVEGGHEIYKDPLILAGLLTSKSNQS